MNAPIDSRPPEPISGRYFGHMSAPTPGGYALDLRVDIDPFHANAVVTNRVSGDIYQVFQRTTSWKVYQESWIVDHPQVTWHEGLVSISGDVRYWEGDHTPTTISLVIAWDEASGPPGPAKVAFIQAGNPTSSYRCEKQANYFRHVIVETDVCKSVNQDPILPSYDTGAHSSRLADLAQRILTIEEAYHEAGIDISINPDRSIIDDSKLKDTNWLPSELHDAMETYFSGIEGQWPKWRVWTMLASGVYEDPKEGLSPNIAGIMFDVSKEYHGAGEGPERQGAAIFRDHDSLKELVAGKPKTDEQAAAQREFLYTYVHEIGHAFNMLHSWNKKRANALSWMNYPWKYDRRRHEKGSYWKNFRFSFDEEELIHLRHGNRAAVIMGGNPVGPGTSYLEMPTGMSFALEGDTPLEFLLRSKPYFDFMEPVIIEIRLKNLTGQPQEIDVQMEPEYGTTRIFIQRPDSLVTQYNPVFCKIATPEPKILKASGQGVHGEDRHSENLMLSYGGDGYYFDQPGEYLMWAIYQGPGDMLIPSNEHRIRIGRPFSREEDRIAQDFFSQEAGMSLYFNGSASPHLRKGMDILQDMAERFQTSAVGAQMSLVVANQLSRDFYRLTKKGKRIRQRKADPEKALTLMERALDQHHQQTEGDVTLDNITYHYLRRKRADLMAAMGDRAEAKNELQTLIKELRAKGVNRPVLDEIVAHAKSI